jgi:hypothetical protein
MRARLFSLRLAPLQRKDFKKKNKGQYADSICHFVVVVDNRSHALLRHASQKDPHYSYTLSQILTDYETALYLALSQIETECETANCHSKVLRYPQPLAKRHHASLS